jgi:SpoIIAA-like
VTEKLKDLPRGIDGVRAVGKISKEDYEQVFVPLLDEARREGRHIRFLYQFGPEFEGFTPGAASEDAKIGLHLLRLFDGCAVVTDLAWIRQWTRLAGFLMPCPMSVFGNTEVNGAVNWLRSLPEGAAISHRLLPESGVIVVEVKQTLRAQDFDSLAFTADAWIEAHRDLQGQVIHVREFPGWENLASLLRHVRFIRDHERKVKKVALATDTKLASLAPSIAEHFIQAEVKSFGYDELDTAIAWAERPSTRSAAAQRSESH